MRSEQFFFCFCVRQNIIVFWLGNRSTSIGGIVVKLMRKINLKSWNNKTHSSNRCPWNRTGKIMKARNEEIMHIHCHLAVEKKREKKSKYKIHLENWNAKSSRLVIVIDKQIFISVFFYKQSYFSCVSYECIGYVMFFSC